MADENEPLKEEAKLDPFDASLDLEKAPARFNKRNMKLVLAGIGVLAAVGAAFSLASQQKSQAASIQKEEEARLEAKPAKTLDTTADDYWPRPAEKQAVYQAEPEMPPPAAAAGPALAAGAGGLAGLGEQDDGRASSLYFESYGANPLAGANPFGGQSNAGLPGPADAYAQQNGQSQNFYTAGGYGGESYGYLKAAAAASRAYGNEIKAGTVLPMAMLTGINSDLPGDIAGQIIADVYDFSGQSLLLPKGTRLIGNYNSSIVFGQTRVMVAWQRLIRPDGVSLELGGMGGADKAGYAGLTGKTDMHYDKIFKAAGMASLFEVGVNAVQAALSHVDFLKNLEKFAAASSSSNSAESLREQSLNVFNEYAAKVINQQPTITVAPGTQARVFVNQDMILPAYRRF